MTALRVLFGDDADLMADRAFQSMLLATLSASIGTALLSPLFDSLIEPLGATTGSIGLLMTVYTAPSVIIIPLGGALTDHYGRKETLVVGLLAFGVAGTAIAATTDFVTVLALRAVQGVAFALVGPVVIASIGDRYAGSEETTAQGFRFASAGVSQAIFPMIAGLLVVLHWRLPFLLYAIAIPIAVIVQLWFEEPTDPGHSPAKPRTDGAPEESGRRRYVRRLLRLGRRPTVLGVLLGSAIPPFVYICFLTYNSIVVVSLLDGTPEQAGVVVALTSVFSAAIGSQTGRVADRFGTRWQPLLLANTMMCLCYAAFAIAPSFPVALVSAVVQGVGFGIALSLYRSVITGIAPDGLRGGLVGAGESLNRLAATAAPVMTGALVGIGTATLGADDALRTAMAGTGVVCAVIGAACVLLAVRRTDRAAGRLPT